MPDHGDDGGSLPEHSSWAGLTKSFGIDFESLVSKYTYGQITVLIQGSTIWSNWENSQVAKSSVRTSTIRPRAKTEKPGALPKPINKMTLREYKEWKGLNHSSLDYSDSQGRQKSAVPVETITS